MPIKPMSEKAYDRQLRKRFFGRVAKLPNGCREWTGSKDPDGYGLLHHRAKNNVIRAHRISWILHKEEIPNGMQVLHRCDNPPCVNPDHLFLGDALANVTDKCRKGRWKGAQYVRLMVRCAYCEKEFPTSPSRRTEFQCCSKSCARKRKKNPTQFEWSKRNSKTRKHMEQPKVRQVLKGHTSPETAFIVESYPYSFRLRCKIRYWLETHPRRGVRFVSQTTNPKRPSEVWNKPKASTYCRFGGCMYLDEQGHVQWTGAHEYMSLEELDKWVATFGEGVPDAAKLALTKWVKMKTAYEEAKRSGAVKMTVVSEETYDLNEAGELVKTGGEVGHA